MRGSVLSWQAPYFCRTEYLNARHHAVVLVVVGYDDTALLFEYTLALLFNQFVSFAHNAVEFYDLRVQGRCKPNAMERVPIAEAQPVGFAIVRRDSANHASMLALAASSVLAAFG